MIGKICLAVFVLGSIVLGSIANANDAFSWESSSIDVSASPDEERVFANFRFKNISPEMVEIKRVVSTCECVTASASKLEISPGESGEVKTVLTVGNRKGLQVKKIVVRTSESGAPYLLTLRVQIPDSYSIYPKSLTWPIGSLPKPQQIEVALSKPEITLTSVETNDSNFQTSVERLDNLCKVQITPKSTAVPKNALLTLKIADPVERKVTLPLSIKELAPR